MRKVLTGMSHNPSVTQLLYVTQEPGDSISWSVFRFLKNPFEQRDFLENLFGAAEFWLIKCLLGWANFDFCSFSAIKTNF